MDNYIGLFQFLNEIPKALGYDYIALNGNNAQFTTVLVRNLSINSVFKWDIENSLLLSKQIDGTVDERLRTLFYNHIWFPNEAKITEDYLYRFIADNIKGEAPDIRIFKVLEYIYSEAPFAGDTIDIEINEESFTGQYWRKLFFHTSNEFSFYIKTTQNLGYIEFLGEHSGGYFGVQLTIKGLQEIIRMESLIHSKTCFVAMSFDEEMFIVYDIAIKSAILETGFEPLLISEKKDIPSDTTINDAILAAIKKSKFTIADFTKHKQAVYFESGYALGRGQKVIYTCREDEIGKAHFDTRNYPHIVWRDAEDLKKQLIDKIEVFIKL